MFEVLYYIDSFHMFSDHVPVMFVYTGNMHAYRQSPNGMKPKGVNKESR